MDEMGASENAEPSINRTLDGITSDSSDESENTDDSIRCNADGDSNEIDEKHLQPEKDDELRFSPVH
jgi:hypothetical protein